MQSGYIFGKDERPVGRWRAALVEEPSTIAFDLEDIDKQQLVRIFLNPNEAHFLAASLRKCIEGEGHVAAKNARTWGWAIVTVGATLLQVRNEQSVAERVEFWLQNDDANAIANGLEPLSHQLRNLQIAARNALPAWKRMIMDVLRRR